MSSVYGIVPADLVPDLMSESDYAALVRDGKAGAEAVDFAALAAKAEAEFHSHLGGTPATAAVQALCKPQALAVLVYCLHRRKYAGGKAEINAAVAKGYETALKWAAEQGARLLASEGLVQGPGMGGVQVTVPDEKWSMTQLGGL